MSIASRSVGYTSSCLRFIQRNPLCLLLILAPITLLTYSTLDLCDPCQFFSRPTPSVLPPPSSLSISSIPSNATSSNATRTPRVLLVSAFFPLTNSKHSLADYKEWLTLFLSHISTEIYFFTPSDWKPIIQEIRGDLPIQINTTFSSPFDIPPLQGRRNDYERMHEKDRERGRHSPELYAAWSSKPYFLKEGFSNACAATPDVAYKYAFWTDAGTFRRYHLWKHWPSLERVDEVWAKGVEESGTKADDLIFFPFEGMPHSNMSSWSEAMGPVDNSISEGGGSFFGGMSSAISWWEQLYYAYHDYWLENGIFVGKDQTLINALFLLFPSRIIGVWFLDPLAPAAVSLLASSPVLSSYDVYNPPPKHKLATPLGQCLNSWYYYLFFLGSKAERVAMINLWLGSWQWMWPWEWLDQLYMAKEPCRLTGVISLENILRTRIFGEAWRPPRPTLALARRLDDDDRATYSE